MRPKLEKTALMISKTIALFSFMLILSGCGWGLFTNRESDPVIEDYLQDGLTGSSRLGILSTTASRRTVVMRMNTPAEGGGGRLCAEPPPDVADALARNTAAELAQSGGSDQPSFQAAFRNQVATSIAPLLYRSQGLQLHRDAAYFLCQQYLNNLIGVEEYNRRSMRIFERAADLVEAEVRIMPKIQRGLLPAPAAAPSLHPPQPGPAQAPRAAEAR